MRMFGMDKSTYKMYASGMNQIEPPSQSEQIAAWPSLADLAEDMTVDVGLVEQWKRRDSIPGRYWDWMALCAHKRGYQQVTLSNLARAASFKEIAA